MDPLTAFSLAGTIIQFVDFGTKLLSGANQLYKSTTGQLAVNEELSLVTCDLEQLITRFHVITSTERDLSKYSTSDMQNRQADFAEICEGAFRVAEELRDKLKGLKLKGSGKHKAWDSMSKAILSAWSQSEIDNLKGRLSAFKEAIGARVLVSIREAIDVHYAHTSARLEHLDEQSQRILTALLDLNPMAMLRQEMREQTNTLTHLLGRVESINQNQYRLNRAALLQSLKQDEYEGKRKQMLTSNDERGLRELDTMWKDDLKKGIEVANESVDLSKAAELELQMSIARDILKSLRPSSLKMRYEQVVEAYPQTFQWILHPPKSVRAPWSNFAQWLEKETGIYWVNGKAGSGKSTLMKYIYDNAQVRQQLLDWAQDLPLCISTFFFWNSGTTEQQSQAGLLRSLLYEVLSQHTNLVPLVFPIAWSKAYSARMSGSDVYFEGWPLQLLKSAFMALGKKCEGQLKIFLLVDGLDEYEGDHHEIAELFQKVAFSPVIKVCVSSRPWITFVNAFQDCPSLRLQDLTASDIAHFVTNRFNKDSAFHALAKREPEIAPKLLSSIVDKAEGVFLWVRLVVKSLLDGMRNRDTVSDLERRLALLPKELAPLYKHLLGLIDDIYLGWASRAFQLARSARSCRFDWIKKEWPLNILDLYIGIDNATMSIMCAAQLSALDSLEIFKDTQTRMTARCAGLLECRQTFSIDDELNETELSSTINKTNMVVRYMHRTARDYIERPDTWDSILQSTKESGFQPIAALARSSVLQAGMKHLVHRRHDMIFRVMAHAHYSDKVICSSNTVLLDDFEKHMSSFEQFHNNHWTADFTTVPYRTAKPFLAFATLFDLTCYTREALEGCDMADRYSLAQSIIEYRNNTKIYQQYDCPRPSVQMRELLSSYKEEIVDAKPDSEVAGNMSRFAPKQHTESSTRAWLKKAFKRKQQK